MHSTLTTMDQSNAMHLMNIRKEINDLRVALKIDLDNSFKKTETEISKVRQMTETIRSNLKDEISEIRTGLRNVIVKNGNEKNDTKVKEQMYEMGLEISRTKEHMSLMDRENKTFLNLFKNEVKDLRTALKLSLDKRNDHQITVNILKDIKDLRNDVNDVNEIVNWLIDDCCECDNENEDEYEDSLDENEDVEEKSEESEDEKSEDEDKESVQEPLRKRQKLDVDKSSSGCDILKYVVFHFFLVFMIVIMINDYESMFVIFNKHVQIVQDRFKQFLVQHDQ